MSVHVVEVVNQRFPDLQSTEENALQLFLEEHQSRLKEKEQELSLCVSETQAVLTDARKCAQECQTTLQSLQERQSKLSPELNDFVRTENASTREGTTVIHGHSLQTSILIRQLESYYETISTLENTEQYLRVLLVVDEIRKQALNLVESSPQEAAVPFGKLVRLHAVVQSDPATRHNRHLVQYLESQKDSLWKELTGRLKSKFANCLERMGWPNVIRSTTAEDAETFRKLFRDLLALQINIKPSEMKDQAVSEASADPSDLSSIPLLLPIEIMLEPLTKRFRYNFEGRRETNRLDKPEWYLTQSTQLFTRHLQFLLQTVQPLLTEYSNPSADNHNASATFLFKYDAKNEFIRGYLINISRKLQYSMPVLLENPSLLSHTIQQVLLFDQSLHNAFDYVPTGRTEFKEGVANVILGDKAWFEAWLNIEKNFALDRFEDIITSGQTWELQEDYIPPETSFGASGNEARKSLIPTKSAIRIMDLIESVTDRYRLLPAFEQRIRFLMDIQLEILESYHARIQAAIDSFDTLSLVKSVPVPGALPDAVIGVMQPVERGGTLDGLRRLCAWYASAQFVSKTLTDMGEDVLFLEMMQQIQEGNGPETVSLTFAPVSDVRKGKEGFLDEPETIFDDTAVELYNTLSERILGLIVKIAVREWSVDARAYGKKRTWDDFEMLSLSTNPNNLNNEELSPELYPPMANLRASLSFLSFTLPENIFLQLYKYIARDLEDWFWRNILSRNQFTAAGRRQFVYDIKNGLWSVGRPSVSKPENYMRRLKAAVVLLSLPVVASSDNSSVIDPRKTCTFLVSTLSSDDDAVEAIMRELDLDALDVETVEDILQRRKDVAVVW